MALSRTSTSSTPRNRNSGRIFGKLIVYLLCLLGSVLMLFPLAWLLRSSVMGLGQIFTFPPEWIPDPWQWQNYPEALTTIPFLRYFFNTLTILILR